MADGPDGSSVKPTTEQLFRSLFRHMGEGVALHEVVLDSAGRPANYRILEVNPQYEGFTGLRPDQVVGRLATEAYGTDTPPYLEAFTSVGMGAPPHRFETYFPPLDRYYEISVAPMGRGFFATIFMDVSERKRQERALQEKTDELDRFFSLSIDMLCIAAVDGRFLRVNAAWASVLGWKVEALEGKRFLDFVHPDDLAATHTALALAAGKPITNFTNRYRGGDGDYRFIEWCSAPAPDGRIYAAARDVTQRMEQERALRASEDRLRRIFELIPSPLALATLDGVIIDCNQALCQLSGYRRDELIGSTGSQIGLWPEAEPQERLAALAADDERQGAELTMRSRDGEIHTLLVASRRLDIEGRPTLIFAAQDLSEKRALEQQMLHAQKLESLGILAGGIAHDFNNLLTGILGGADLAARGLSLLSPAREHLADIGTAAKRAAELCRQLLAYSGKGRFLVQPLDLAELVREMGHLLSVSISKKVALHYRVAPAVPAIEADPAQVRQIVMNLIVNASEAIGEKGGAIEVATGMALCDAAFLRDCHPATGIEPGEFVFLEVSDDGSGMDGATLARIFDPFFTTKFTGRGLGLAAVLGIMRGHRGAIHVDSTPGRGTTFRLFFPPSADRPATPVAPAPQAEEAAGHGLILLVDDETAVRNAASGMLEEAGFTVLTAANGKEAVAAFERDKERIVLVVLDLTMPELDGSACFRALRSLKPDVKVLLTSGYDEQDAVNAFSGEGLAGFLQKPFTFDELLAKVREAL
jgi:two-component system cell cycle sensor histidine kinase/response regulator CckA